MSAGSFCDASSCAWMRKAFRLPAPAYPSICRGWPRTSIQLQPRKILVEFALEGGFLFLDLRGFIAKFLEFGFLLVEFFDIALVKLGVLAQARHVLANASLLLRDFLE